MGRESLLRQNVPCRVYAAVLAVMHSALAVIVGGLAWTGGHVSHYTDSTLYCGGVGAVTFPRSDTQWLAYRPL